MSLIHCPEVRPTIARLSLLGEPEVGKTTLVKTLQKGWLHNVAASIVSRSASPPPGSPKYIRERTDGVAISDLPLNSTDNIRVFDFAGQQHFVAAHCPLIFMPYGTYLLMLNLSKPEETLRRHAKYWLSFVIASHDTQSTLYDATSPGGQAILPQLCVVFTHKDVQHDPDMPPRLCQWLRGHYSSHFRFVSEGPFLIDARRWTNSMAAMKSAISKASSQAIKVNQTVFTVILMFPCHQGKSDGFHSDTHVPRPSR